MSTIAPTLPPARWWRTLEEKKVVCSLCPRECHIPDGSKGFCFVRANIDGKLELTTYGRSSGFCIDPIEKKPLNHFLPGTPTLSFGTAGCNLGCKFCQNWDISKSREMDTIAQTATPEAIVEAAVRHGCRSLAFTYNDPVIWAEYALDIAKVAHERGLKTVAVTAGYIGEEARAEFFAQMDAANVDIKGFTEVFYRKLCQGQLQPILDTLKFLKHQTNVWFELTNLMIPGENDSAEETREMCGWIVDNLGPDVPVHFTAFHPDFKMLDTPATPPETLLQARQLALAAGIRYAYVGNVTDPANQSTYCHGCGKMLIERNWHKIGQYHLRGSACEYCGATLPGLFDETGPGTWGGGRQPISIGQEPQQLTNFTSTATADSGMDGTSPTEPPVPTDNVPAPVAPKINFTAEEDAQILDFARAIIDAALRNQSVVNARLPEALAAAPAYGMFVSLHRGKQLRSCKGQHGMGPSGALTSLAQMLAMVAADAACNDPRFPRITPGELPLLFIEVSLMHSPELITASGEDRLKCVEVGKHGLVIMHPNGRGLLLPQVAVEAKWDSRTFLEQTCNKAGLGPRTWLDEDASLMTFQARKISAPPQVAELNVEELGVNGLGQLLGCVQQLLAGRAQPTVDQNQAAALQLVHPEELGLCLQTPSGMNSATIGPGNSLLSMAAGAAKSLAQAMAQRGRAEPLQRMTLLWQPLLLSAADYPMRHRMLGGCAVLAQANGRWSLMVPQPDNRTDPIAQSLASLRVTHQQWLDDRQGQIRIMTFNAVHCNCQPAGQVPAASAATMVRAAFRAGAFYPGDAATCAAEADGFLKAGGLGQAAAQSYRAIMLPHAGWRFCGSTMGKTLAGVKIPKTVILIGPKHTPLGPACSVASHTAWQIPGATIPLDTAIVQRLCRVVPDLQCEPQAHLQEHGSEVILPFLQRLRPEVNIVPIALGQCSMETITALADELSKIVADARNVGNEPPLLLISSDMNHYAPEPENRRRDMMAIEALTSGNPMQLLDTCRQNEISMCGVLPAMTIMMALQHQTPEIHPRLIDYTNSAAASGDASSVVGYAGMVIE